MPEPAHVPPEPNVPQGDVRQLPVLAQSRPVARAEPAPVPATLVAATGGFLLGVATFVLGRVLRRPRPVGVRLPRGRRGGDRVEVAATRSFLVDVHLLNRR